MKTKNKTKKQDIKLQPNEDNFKQGGCSKFKLIALTNVSRSQKKKD